MPHFLNKTILFLITAVVYAQFAGAGAAVTIPLVALSVSLLLTIMTLSKDFLVGYRRLAGAVILAALCLWQPNFNPFLPLFVYDFTPRPHPGHGTPGAYGAPGANKPDDVKNIVAEFGGIFFVIPSVTNFHPLTALLTVLAAVLDYVTATAVDRHGQLHRQRDNYEQIYSQLQERLRTQGLAAEKDRHMARLDERNRISRELHDVTGHTLSSALLQVGALEVLNQDKTLKEPLRQLHETLDWGMSGIQEAIRGLYADSFDLKAELEKILQRVQGFETRLNYPGDTELPLDMRFNMLQIAREAVTNAAKYSNGNGIVITVSVQPTLVALNIRDNGNGASDFDVDDEAELGIGLRSIREIVKRENGLLNVGYEEGRGFIVHAVFFRRENVNSKQHNNSHEMVRETDGEE